MEEQKRNAQIGVRVPRTLKELVRIFVEKDTHLNEAEFVRDAIREKIHREAPNLYALIFTKGLETESPTREAC